MAKKQTSTRSRQVKAAPVKKTLGAKARHHTRHLLVPHKGNDYRPHLIRPQGLAVVLAIALLAQVVYSTVKTGEFAVLGRSSNITSVDLLNDTNAEREAEGLAALQLNDTLSQAATLKAQDMLDEGYWAHNSPSGVTPWKWLGDVGYSYSVAGENLAKNYPTAAATVAAWMDSETHRANIMDSRYQDVGFAVADGVLNGRETTLIVAYYGAPQTRGFAAATNGTVEQAPPVASSFANPVQTFGNALQSLSPVTVMVLGLFGLVAIIGAAAHHYRDRLPRAWKQSWRLHHGMYTFWGMLGLGVLVIIATGGGSI